MPRGTPQRPGKSRGIDGGLWKTRGRKPAGDMSNQNSSVSETESECDFYSDCWDEIALPISQDLVNSDSESNHCLPVKSPCGLFEKQKQKSKISKLVEISGNDQTNFKNCCKDYPLLQAQKLDNTGEFRVKLLPESILHLNVKDYHSSDHPSKTYSSKQNSLRYLNRKIPHIADKLVKEQTLKETCIFHKLHQKLSTADNTSTSKHNKAVQVFFPCRETETGKNIVCECFKQSAIPAEDSSQINHGWKILDGNHKCC
ncbi:uncharacterized protein LOC123031935 isoform X1 [Varanus komodoensis]|uniref:uncharacterized protein LOC123031935 isoform X1 n=1 Tax=Varanus komodoensis TaxID=61221 RepID=UPI001CF7C6CD|nr:uncharacterized protein LOC123031935 isoform X1 [Varanus komodoensis]